MRAVFLRVLEASEKSTALRAAVDPIAAANSGHRFEVKLKSFLDVPRSPFAYWVSDRLRQLFADLMSFATEGREAWVGLQTNNDFQWLRLWYEIRPEDLRNGRAVEYTSAWVPYAKGGEYARYYSNIHLVLQWGQNGRHLKEWKLEELRKGRITANNSQCWNESEYFQFGLTWSQRSQKGLSVRALPGGAIFGIKGPGAFCRMDKSETLAFLALFNSASFIALVNMQMAFGSYDTGVIRRTPIPRNWTGAIECLGRLGEEAWRLGRRVDSCHECSRAFTLPALLQVEGDTLAQRGTAWGGRIIGVRAELTSIQAEVDEHCFELYGIEKLDRQAIADGFGGMNSTMTATVDLETYTDADSETADVEDADVNLIGLTANLTSWTLGVGLGRFDVRLATGERGPPPEPGPFDPLPPCSPGMLTGQEGLLLEAPPPTYPIDFPRDGILADDPGNRVDITRRIHIVFECVFSTEADRIWGEAAQILGNGDGDLRRWLSRSLFEDTIRRYSKSRRKAPIYWQLATPSANYSIWLYCHRLTKETFYTVLSDHVDPKLQHEERRLGALLAESGDSPNAGQRRQIAEQEEFVNELRTFREEVARIAPLWNPNYDDGVIINFAPLWRLVPQHRAWQSECKACWDKLVAGDYDWSHLAMHLWPERVVPKGADDRSLAIAHGLEDRFWVGDLGGRWRPRQSIDGTVRYLEQQLLSRALTQTVGELEAFLKEHGARHASPGKTWWKALSGGDHDDHPLALALWPERVLSKAHGSRNQNPRHDQAELTMLASFCDYVGSLSEWSERWAALHAGDLDEEPIARFLYPRRVVERAQKDPDFAEKHDLTRWFWLDEPGRSRRLMEPEQELAAAVKERESAAVKAALKGLLEAPVTNGSSRRGRRQAAR
jgi:hypothetical protein